MFAQYDDYDALGLAELVKKGDVKSSELVEECIARIERVNPRLNCVVHPMYEQARAAQPSTGPFQGVPFLLKDLLQTVRGVPTSSGSRFFAGMPADRDSELYVRYRKAGLVAVAKTATPELGLLPVTETDLHGPTRNPWKLERTPGGSSGGSGSAVGAGIVPMAHGGDGGGSIRIPASCCGIFGLKPTRARTPTGPTASEGWSGFAIEHVLSRSVRDSAAALDATIGAEPYAPYHAPTVTRPFLEETTREPGRLRIGFHWEAAMLGDVHPDCIAAVKDAAKLLEELGHDVEEVRPQHDREHLTRSFFTVVSANTAAEIDEGARRLGKKARPADFETATWLGAQMGRSFDGATTLLAIRDLQTETRRLAHRLGDYDVILTPTLGRPPLEVGALRPKGLEGKVQDFVKALNLRGALKLPGLLERTLRDVFAFIPFTPVANFTGQPSMNVPLFWNAENLPIGTMFTARFGDEATLFRLAAQLEKARPWAARRAPNHAGLAS
ncbi:MAG: amidase [Sandaracinus sp.]|nr:amidase [Sandaracinus sp.]